MKETKLVKTIKATFDNDFLKSNSSLYGFYNKRYNEVLAKLNKNFPLSKELAESIEEFLNELNSNVLCLLCETENQENMLNDYKEIFENKKELLTKNDKLCFNEFYNKTYLCIKNLQESLVDFSDLIEDTISFMNSKLVDYDFVAIIPLEISSKPIFAAPVDILRISLENKKIEIPKTLQNVFNRTKKLDIRYKDFILVTTKEIDLIKEYNSKTGNNYNFPIWNYDTLDELEFNGDYLEAVFEEFVPKL